VTLASVDALVAASEYWPDPGDLWLSPLSLWSFCWLRCVVYVVWIQNILVVAWLVLCRMSGFWPLQPRRAAASVEDPAGAGANLWSRRMGRAGCAVLVTSVFAPCAVLYAMMIPRWHPSLPELPEPNGYEMILQAVDDVHPEDVPDAAVTALPEIRVYLQRKREPLRTIRSSLRHSSYVPYEYSQYARIEPDRTNHYQSIRKLFELEAYVAQQENRVADAADIAFDLIHLGRPLSRGGMLGERSADYAFELAGLSILESIRKDLTASECVEVLRDLERCDANREPLHEVQRRELIWLDSVYGWRCRLVALIDPEECLHSHYFSPRIMMRRFRIGDATRHLMIADLAIQAYDLQEQRYPDNLQQLVPAYLRRVPIDPFSDRPLRYQPTGDGYLLYSLGPNEQDDGGRRVTRIEMVTGDGDLMLDMPEPDAED
jgi:hypothetical protein